MLPGTTCAEKIRFDTPASLLFCRAQQIVDKIARQGTLQVRLYQGRLLTYRWPLSSSRGAHGKLIGVYTRSARFDWILDDLKEAMHAIT